MKPTLNPHAPAFPARGSQEELAAWAQRFSLRASSGSFTEASRTSEELPSHSDNPIIELLPEDPFGMSPSPSGLNLEQRLSLGLSRRRTQSHSRHFLEERIGATSPIPVPGTGQSQTSVSAQTSLDRVPSFFTSSPTAASGSWSTFGHGSNPELDLIMEAACTGQLDLLERIPQRTLAALCDDRGRSTIYLVCEKQFGGQVIDALLNCGASIDATDPEGNTPLMLAVKNNKMVGVVTLLLRNANPDKQDAAGRSAWQVAQASSNVRLADTLQRFGAQSGNSGTNVRARLLDAMNERNLDEVLKYASMFDGKEALSSDGRTALHLASAEGDVAIMRVLLAAGLKPNVVDRLGNAPLHHAKASGSEEACLLLEKFGAFKDLKNSNGLTPSDFARAVTQAAE